MALLCTGAVQEVRSACNSTDAHIDGAPPGLCLKWAGQNLTSSCRRCLNDQVVQEALRGAGPPRRSFIPTLEVNNWAGHQVQGTILRIIMEEVLGYQTNTLYRTDSSFAIERVRSGCATMNPEVWNPQRKHGFRYLGEGGLRSGNQGSIGTEGFFVAGDAQGVRSTYKLIQEGQVCTTAAMEGFPKDGTTQVTQWAGCPSNLNCTNGRWHPPRCQPLNARGYSDVCYEIYMGHPEWSDGWLEAVVHRLGLNFSLVYLGGNRSLLQEKCRNLTSSAAVMFYWWTPSLLVFQCHASALQLPIYNKACANSYDQDPLRSQVNCSKPGESLLKISKVAGEPDLEALFDGYAISNAMQDQLLESLDGGETIEDVACNWVVTHAEIWNQWLATPTGAPAQDEKNTGLLNVPVAVFVSSVVLASLVCILCACFAINVWHHRRLISQISPLEPLRQVGDLSLETHLDTLVEQAEALVAQLRRSCCRRRHTLSELQGLLAEIRSMPNDQLLNCDIGKVLTNAGVDSQARAEVSAYFNSSITGDLRGRKNQLLSHAAGAAGYVSSRIQALQPTAFFNKHYDDAPEVPTECTVVPNSPSLPMDEIPELQVESELDDLPLNSDSLISQFSVTLDEVRQWCEFDVFQVACTMEPGSLLPQLFYSIVDKGFNGVIPLKVPRNSLREALLEAQATYEAPRGSTQNSYHNALHAADVLCTSAALLCRLPTSITRVSEMLPITKFAVGIAALFHDYKHPGVSARYLELTHDHLAITYSDDSVLERMHLAEMFKLLLKHNVFSAANTEDYRTFRRLVIDMVLATDLSHGFKTAAAVRSAFPEAQGSHGKGTPILSRCTSPIEDNLSPTRDSTPHGTDEPIDRLRTKQSSSLNSTKLQELRQQKNFDKIMAPATREFMPAKQRPSASMKRQPSRVVDVQKEHACVNPILLNFILECADISHPAKSWDIHLCWSFLVTKEFLAQGTIEVDQGLPVSPLCNKESIMDPGKFPRSQQGFIDFVVAPKFRILSSVMGDDTMVHNLEANHANWGAANAPSFAEVSARMAKKSALSDARASIQHTPKQTCFANGGLN